MSKMSKRDRMQPTPLVPESPQWDLEYAQYERKLEIDKNRLDDALIEHPALLARVSENYATLISQRDGYKDRIKRVEAETNLACRRKLEAEGQKITEGIVDATVTSSKERAKAHKQWLVAVQEAERWSGLLESFRERGYVLRTLADLWAGSYFATSAVKGENSRQIQDMENERRRAAMTEARQNKKSNGKRKG